MSFHNSSPTRRDIMDAVLKHDAKFYKKAWQKMRDAERVNNERALGNRYLWEKLKKLKPSASCEDLMSLAHHLEDQGMLEEAADAYQQLLTNPHFQQQDNQELRVHLAQLVAKSNRRKAEAQALQRQAELEEEGRLQPGRPRGLEPPRSAGVPRGNKAVGPKMPMSSDAYRAELAAQAMAAKRRKEAARREEEMLEGKQVAIAAAMEALDRYQRQVVGGNDRKAYARELELERKTREEERRRQFYSEWDELKARAESGPSGPLGGVDEYERRRAQGADGGMPPSPRYRPVSAGAAVAARARERELDRNNAANFDRLYVPGHPYAPVSGPPLPAAAWPAPPSPGAGGAGGWILKAPFSRPDVDRPRVTFDPKVVRAHQQVFYDKHRKPVPPAKQEVPLRRRKEAERRPSSPQIAPSAYRAW